MNNAVNSDQQVKDKVRQLLDAQTKSGHHTFRNYKDLIARYGIAVGGVSVILAVLMIFFYLLYVVFPILKSAEINQEPSYSFSTPTSMLWGMEEYGEIGFSYSESGEVEFFDTSNGSLITTLSLPLEAGETVTSVTFANRDENIVAVGLSSGYVRVFKQTFKVSYPDNKRKITPGLSYPFGDEPIELGSSPVIHIAAAKNDEQLSIVAAMDSKTLVYSRFDFEESFLDESLELDEVLRQEINTDISVDFLAHDPAAQWVYVVAKSGQLQSFWFDDELISNETLSLVEQGVELSEFKLLLGGTSLLVGDSRGVISQWFPVRDDTNTYRLSKIRSFELGNSAIVDIQPEYRRKGFLAINENNKLGLFFTTSHRTLLTETLPNLSGTATLAINPRANRLLLLDDGQMKSWQVDNEHPDLSWSALWSEVWYEDYREPEYTWQSSASNNDFEAKFSLVPLSFGTLKAAFYAMLFAMPLAICGAIFTAYFMAPAMRKMVKPSVETMEALPTVILGFLAGLWLAPIMEAHLPGIFMMLLLLPIGIILFGLAWHFAPIPVRTLVPDGWQAAMLIPVIILIAWACLALSYPMEQLLFDGDMRVWLESIGLNYDQRNSMVVGVAMGFAVIPTIFSIAEDAIFSVPRHLTNGSLALGASPWQTLVRVVLPTASPGIFSAVMIGLGRAVGETMIVLMATGNTPIMEANIFEGMRTLSANIAVEMPESAVGSSHYRVLFLAGFVLFLFTFFFNTVAENVRHRLRKKYSSL